MSDTQERIAQSMATLVETLERLTLTMEVIAGVLLPPQEHEVQGCPHPEESRINLSTMGQLGKFKCRDCGYRN